MNVYVLEHILPMLIRPIKKKLLFMCNFNGFSASNYKKHYHAYGSQHGVTTVYGNH